MPDLEYVTRTVTLLDLAMGDPPTILTFERLVGLGGKTKPFTQKVPVPDPVLFASLLAEARKGDLIEIATVTDWSAEGLPTHLTRFSVVRGTAPTADETAMRGQGVTPAAKDAVSPG
ncbi:MAG: hypothetical protein H0V51_09380 [Chloroflexi bacterium]|nr:hypothetical protein [Chloroflexota bacterium]